MGPCRFVVAVAVAAVALAACSGGRSGQRHSVGASGIRGTHIDAFSCHAPFADGSSVRLPAASVRELRICPVVAPSPFNRPQHAITLAPGSTHFEALLSALSLPDGVRAPNVMCPAYAELIQPVHAQTGSGPLLVHLPVDGCDHTLPAVSAALNAVLNGTGS